MYRAKRSVPFGYVGKAVSGGPINERDLRAWLSEISGVLERNSKLITQHNHDVKRAIESHNLASLKHAPDQLADIWNELVGVGTFLSILTRTWKWDQTTTERSAMNRRRQQRKQSTQRGQDQT